MGTLDKALALALSCLACTGSAPGRGARIEPGTIRGTVLGPEGHGVPGVLVATTRPESGSWRDLLDAGSTSALTDIDGRFELHDISPGALRVAAYARECPPGEGALVELRDGEGVAQLEIPLWRPTAAMNPLRVRVLDPGGEIVRYAQVVCTPRPGCEHGDFARPSADRSSFEIWRMAGERVSLRASLEQLPRAPAALLLAPAYAFDVPPEQSDLELRLPARPARTLLVVDEDGTEITQFAWQALDEHQFRRRDTGAIQRNDFGLAIDSFRAGSMPAEHWRRWSMVDGRRSGNRDREQIPDLGGPFLVQVAAIGFEPAEYGPFGSTDAPAEIRIVLRRAPEIRGVVVADGVPAAGATVRLLTPQLAFEDSGQTPWPEHVLSAREDLYRERTRATTAADGSFRLLRGETGRCLLRIGIDPAAEVEAGPFDLEPRESRTGLRIELPQRGSIEGRIRTRAGREVAGHFATATRNTGNDLLVAPIEADGSFRFAQLAPGRWTLRESRFDPSQGQFCRTYLQERRPTEADPFTCEVRAGQTTQMVIDLTKPVRFSARVDLPGYERAQLTFELMGSGSTFAEGKFGTTAEPGNEFAVELDQAGEYELRLVLHRFPHFDTLEVQERVRLHEGENHWSLRGATGDLRVSGSRLGYSKCATRRDGRERTLRLHIHSAASPEFLVEDVPAGTWRIDRSNWNDPIIPDVVTVEPGKTAGLVLH